MINEIIENLEFAPDGGALMYSGVRYMLIRPETVVEIQRLLSEEVGLERAGQIFYQAGQRGGTLSASYFRQEMNLDPVDIVRFMAQMGGQIGWGRMEISEIDPSRGMLELEVYHSVFAETYGKSDVPICHMIRGVFSGAWGRAIEQEVRGLETRCRAVEGPGPCRFVFASGTADTVTIPFKPE